MHRELCKTLPASGPFCANNSSASSCGWATACFVGKPLNNFNSKSKLQTVCAEKGVFVNLYLMDPHQEVDTRRKHMPQPSNSKWMLDLRVLGEKKIRESFCNAKERRNAKLRVLGWLRRLKIAKVGTEEMSG